jgi:SAM-dependent methyltransferase
VDVGAGDLFFTRALAAQSGVRTIAVDPCLADADLALGDGIQRCRDVMCVPSGIGDWAIMMDVLEHVADDAALLSAVRRVVKPGGRILVTVPAYQFLFSVHDRFLQHHRRYGRKTLLRLLASGGLETVQVFHFYTSLFLVRLATRGLIAREAPERQGVGHWHYPAAHFLTRLLTLALNLDFAAGRLLSRLGLNIPGLSLCAICRNPSA